MYVRYPMLNWDPSSKLCWKGKACSTSSLSDFLLHQQVAGVCTVHVIDFDLCGLAFCHGLARFLGGSSVISGFVGGLSLASRGGLGLWTWSATMLAFATVGDLCHGNELLQALLYSAWSAGGVLSSELLGDSFEINLDFLDFEDRKEELSVIFQAPCHSRHREDVVDFVVAVEVESAGEVRRKIRVLTDA